MVSTVFAQRIPPNKPVIVKVTSTECNVCGLKAWDELKEVIDLYDDEAVIMSVHPLELSLLFSNTSLEFVENMPQFFGTPSFYINREVQPFNFWLGGVRETIEAFQERQIIAHPSVKYAIEGQELKVEVTTEFFKKANRPHHVSVFVLEDEVIEDQSSRGPDETHSKILRTHIGEDVFGTLLSAEPIEIGQVFINNYSLPLNEKWNPNKIQIAVIIWERNTDNYVIVNSNVATEPTELSTSINFLEAAQVELSIQPTILIDAATIEVVVPTALENLNLNIVNTLGQTVQTVFSGKLTKGNHSFLLNRNDFNSSGFYFLVLEKGGSKLIQKIIIK